MKLPNHPFQISNTVHIRHPLSKQTRGRYDTPQAPRIRARSILGGRQRSQNRSQRVSQSRLLLHLLAPEETLPLLIDRAQHSFERVSANSSSGFRDLIRLGMIQRVMECVWPRRLCHYGSRSDEALDIDSDGIFVAISGFRVVISRYLDGDNPEMAIIYRATRDVGQTSSKVLVFFDTLAIPECRNGGVT
ncbi:hypothetical protein CEXT_201921 [Caerostris extrusa]|uniref:Uncharacterized protein n=1 Tax=Caerostris extrusa TaxID=172846 RepID=A0AAV4T5A0_CAEEX|nr:hypothetical protein CEXT_201921 [Caerostris extrusa]